MIPSCGCGRISADGNYVQGRDCPLCHLWKHSPESTKPRTPVASQIRPAEKSKPDCIHIGIRVNVKTGSCRGSYECEKGHGVVRPCVECKTCKDYQADDVV